MTEEMANALSRPFDPKEVKAKPAVVSGNRALAMFYIDARLVQDRLDEVLGVGCWKDDYEVLADNSVVCRLSLKINDEWITKTDVGGQSEQPDEGDRMKAAFSDALKRAAVKFGIGRYLYRIPSQWVDYDPQKKKFAVPPRIPQVLTKPTPVARANAAQTTAVDTLAVWWKEYLASDPSLADLNKAIQDVQKLEMPTKRTVWDMIIAHAKRAELEFDLDTKTFIHKTPTHR